VPFYGSVEEIQNRYYYRHKFGDDLVKVYGL